MKNRKGHRWSEQSTETEQSTENEPDFRDWHSRTLENINDLKKYSEVEDVTKKVSLGFWGNFKSALYQDKRFILVSSLLRRNDK